MAALQFVFSSFWVFIGTLVLLVSAGEAIASVVRAFRGKGHE